MDDDSESLQSRSDTRCEENTVKSRLNASRNVPTISKEARKRTEQLSHSPKSTKEEFKTRSETDFEDDEQSARKRYTQYRGARDPGTEIDLLVNSHKKFHHNREKYLLVICPVNKHFQEALEYSTYLLTDMSFHYDE